ncbi:unnamed protein product [Dovyalis caffra]|uniref:Uncharacterized protein n=1 Tax=Dovyalis caffra TaxID=77055 RepID=A0AAV1S7Z3_9ROSI|nr:unnamed protein product [Dovyalis caffra]
MYGFQASRKLNKSHKQCLSFLAASSISFEIARDPAASSPSSPSVRFSNSLLVGVSILFLDPSPSQSDKPMHLLSSSTPMTYSLLPASIKFLTGIWSEFARMKEVRWLALAIGGYDNRNGNG